MNFLAVKGTGDPNEENGAYQHALQLLYPLCYTLKMSYKGTHKIDGFFEYVVSTLEGFWWQDGFHGMDHSRAKDAAYEQDFSKNRYHHEIYLGDPRKCRKDKRKTVIRHPVKKIG